MAELLGVLFGLELPAWDEAVAGPADLPELKPTEYRADAVTVLRGATGRRVLAVVNEVQLGTDEDKRRTWPNYLTTLHARLKCPVMLMVICVDAATAAWCAAPISVGHPGWVLRPLVLGPGRVPVVTDPGQAERVPELAVLSALAHGGGPEHEDVLRAMLHGLQHVDRDHADMYTDIVASRLPEAARRCLEALMNVATYEPQSEMFRRHWIHGRAEGEAEGRAEGEAAALLAVLAARGIQLSDEARQRITDCRDLEQLDAWIRRAATAESTDDLFG